MESFLQNNDTEMLSTRNERKSVVAERFIRTLKDKIYKHMTSISRNVSNDKLDYIIDKYNNTYHSKIKMKPVDVISNTYTDYIELTIKILNLKLVILLEYQNIKIFLQKATPQIDLKKIFRLKELKILCPGHMLLKILKWRGNC